jgi:hypothetical protein
MNHAYINENNLLPFNDAFLYEGVFVLWKLKQETSRASKTTWHAQMTFNTMEDREFLNTLHFIGEVEHYFGSYEGKGPVDYVILGADGQILKTNFNAQVICDENGFTHITSSEHVELDYLVIPFESVSKRYIYCSGKDFNELNKSVRRAVERKWMKRPKFFRKDEGLTIRPVQKDSLGK